MKKGSRKSSKIEHDELPGDVLRAKEAARKRAERAKVKTEMARLQGHLELAQASLSMETAGQFVRLLSAGVPGLEALSFFSPHFDVFSEEMRLAWLTSWMGSREVGLAVAEANRGPWTELSDDARRDIALRHATNQMAHFLKTRDYHSVVGADLSKWQDARKALQAQIDSQAGGGESAYDKFLKQLMTASATAAAGGPPQLAGPPIAELTKRMLARDKKVN